MIHFDNISLKYMGEDKQNKFILKDLSLEIDKAEFVCLLGPSGCGKSSLLGLLAGFIKANQGQVLVSGNKVLRPDITRTLVFQEYALFPWLNVIENVAFGLKNKITDKQERFMIASRYLRMVGLLDHAKDKIAQLSGGMKQRVAIARALVVRPDLLLMDEPFGALDDKTRSEMQKQLINIWSDLKPTVVFVTHSVDEALLLADRIIVMNKTTGKDYLGEIQADIKIPLQRPRKLIELNDYRNQVMDILHGEENKGDYVFDAMI